MGKEGQPITKEARKARLLEHYQEIRQKNINEAKKWLEHPFLFRLTPGQQEVLLLRYSPDGFRPRSFEEVASVLEVSRSAVQSIVNGAKARLARIDARMAYGEAVFSSPLFSKLPERQQLVLSGYFGSGEIPPLTVTEMGVSLGISHQAVSASRRSALRKFIFA